METVVFEIIFESVDENVDISWRPADGEQDDDCEDHLGDLLTILRQFLPG